jgi:D-beta-D-heptose 7-phosphate kinase/D-beta-D-heptose 1-phosphate adenosyltransferase
VDVVVIFEEDTPLELIQTLLPDVLVKGGDYTIETIVGAKEVIANGGKVIINPIVEGFSTTNIIEKIKK